MTEWQPNWPALEANAATLVASNPRAALIEAVTPSGGYVEIALRASLAQVLEHAGAGLSGPLVIAVDTLEIAAGETVINAPAVSIVARSVQVQGGGSATIVIRAEPSGAAIELTTAGIEGSLVVQFQTRSGAQVPGPGNGPLALDGLRTPQSILASPSSAAVASTDALTIADELHEPWAIVVLELGAEVASQLIDEGTPGALALAANMLGWVCGGCSALLANRSQFPKLDFTNIASLQTSAVGLLSFTQSQTSGATYVPVLSASAYQQQVEALLELAGTYDAKITAFKQEENLEQLLEELSQTLGENFRQAQKPLINSLQRLADEAGSVQSQLTNAAVQLGNVSETLEPLRKALVEAIEDQFHKELVQTALETLVTVTTLYIGSAAAILGDPEVLAGKSSAIIKAASEIATKLIEAGQKTIGQAISGSYESATLPPSPETSKATAEGAQYLAGSMANFGSAVALLWAVIAQACSKQPPDLSPNLAEAVDKLPDLSGFSVGGLDPTTYWKAVVVQTEAAVQPNAKLPQAGAYLEAMQLVATYGSAVGDLQWKLLELYTQAMTVFDQLVAAGEAEASWKALAQSLRSDAEKAAAAIGLLERGYLNVKRSLVLAIENYRAAFLYQWLQPASVEANASMRLIELREQATNAIAGLNEVLAGKSSGPVRPRQKFQHVIYSVQQDDLFRATEGAEGEARFTIDTTALAAQLKGDSALYLTSAAFELEGGSQDGEVELEIESSGHYENELGKHPYRFVSRPVSMTNNYLPGEPPKFVTQWEFADAASYLMPTPYTNWTLIVSQGDWAHATAIKIEFAGLLLQNP